MVDGSPVGYVDLYGDKPKVRELGYLVAQSFRWDQALGTVLARGGIAYGFGVVGLRGIWAEAIEAHEASLRE